MMGSSPLTPLTPCETLLLLNTCSAPDAPAMPFIQTPPTLGNQYDDDAALRSLLSRVLPAEVHTEVEPSLREMGRLSAELYPAQLADLPNEPRLVQWDAWGNRVDRIELTPLWLRAERIAAEHGVVAAAYARAHGRFSRLHQFALAYLFTPSTDIYSCPLAMTDGAARALLESGHRALIDRAVPRLTSRDPAAFWTTVATGEPPSTARIIPRIDSGFIGSTARALLTARNGRAHHCRAMTVSTAKIGSPGRKAPSSRPSRNEAWLAAMTAFGITCRMCSSPCTSTR